MSSADDNLPVAWRRPAESVALPTATRMRVQFTMPRFADRTPPRGFLVDDPGCHALYYYSILARRAQERTSSDPNLQAVIYDGELDEGVNYRQLFKSIAFGYGIPPERMEKFWSNVDMQLLMEGCPKLEGGARFEWKPVVNSSAATAGVSVSPSAPRKSKGGIILP